MASSLSGKRPSDAEWLKHKLTIERMFVTEKKSLVETRQRLESDGFLITKAQLEYKLKLWGFRRRIPKTKSDAVWQFIGRRIERRKQQGKDTEVVLGKQIFDAAKVYKEIKRYQETTVARFSQPSPMTPEGLEIFLNTPASLPMQVLWPTSLPWSKCKDSSQLVVSATGLLKNTKNTSKELRCQNEDLSFADMLRFIAPQYVAGNSVTQLAAEIESIMPESHESENFGRASRLLQGTADERCSEYLKIILYKISNNFFPAWESKIPGSVSCTEWENITEMLETSGVMKTSIQCGNISDVTMAAMMEQTFRQAMLKISSEPPSNSLEMSSPGRTIAWLLQSGQSPDMRIQHYMYARSARTPLQMAARMRSLQLMSRLLDHGACPDLSYEPWDDLDGPWTGELIHPLLDTILHYDEFGEGCLGMVQRLLKLNSTVSMDSAIRMMMEYGRYFPPDLMEVLMRNGPDIFQSIKAPKDAAWFIETFSIIGCTAKYSCEPNELHLFFRLLHDARIQNRSQIPEAVDTTSIVLLAAADGNTTFLEDLHSYGIDIMATGYLGSSAIDVAAYYGHLETCKKLLLEHHVPLNAVESNTQVPPSLHFAVAGGNLDIVSLFHQSKIDVNEVFEDRQGEWSAFFGWGRRRWLGSRFTAVEVALHLSKKDIARYLLENGARAPPWDPNWVPGYMYPKTFDTAKGLSTAVKLAPSVKADRYWRAFASSIRSQRIRDQFRQALKQGQTILAQQLILDAQEDDLWNDPDMSILEAAIITGHQQTVEKTFARNPGSYDPGALCAKLLFSSSSTDGITIHQLLSNRPQSEQTSPLEALAIGLAAWSGQIEVLKLLLAEFDQPVLVKAPTVLRGGLPRFSAVKFARNGLPFWHRRDGVRPISPTLFALRSREALSLMLNHGYKPDRFTMRAAIEDFDLDNLKILVKSPRLPDRPRSRIQGPLSYAVTHKKYDVVRFLLDNGEDVNENNYHVSDYDGESARNPLQSAVENSDLYLIDLLLHCGADVNTPAARYYGATASQFAAITGRLGILRTLVDHGADINARRAVLGGRTALEGAAEHGRIDTIQYLLSIGVRTTDGDRLQYLRAIRYAQIEAHEVAVNLLRGHREWTTDDHVLWTALKGWDLRQLNLQSGPLIEWIT